MRPTPPAVLVVDDDETILCSLRGTLAREAFRVVATASPREALAHLREEPFAVIVSDQHMAELSGLDFLEQARALQPHASRVLITGALSLNLAIESINRGEIFRFLAKPWARAELLATLHNAVDRWELLESNARLQADTLRLNRELAEANGRLANRVETVEGQRRALQQAHAALGENFDRSLELCGRLIEVYHPLLSERSRAVADLCRRMGDSGHLDATERHVLAVSAPLHDIGLLGAPRTLIRKLGEGPGATFTAEETAALHLHPVLGQTLVSFVDSLRAVGETIRAHHERHDGRGYPDGLGGESIPWTARCLAVAVGYVESGLPRAAALESVLERSGTWFDPEAVRLFLRVAEGAPLPRRVREVLLDELSPGMALARGIYNPAGLLLVSEGHELDETTIDKLRKHQQINSLHGRLLVHG